MDAPKKIKLGKHHQSHPVFISKHRTKPKNISLNPCIQSILRRIIICTNMNKLSRSNMVSDVLSWISSFFNSIKKIVDESCFKKSDSNEIIREYCR